MKVKLALLLVAALASTALVASAQQPGTPQGQGQPSYVITGRPPGQDNAAGRLAVMRAVPLAQPGAPQGGSAPQWNKFQTSTVYSQNIPNFYVNFSPEESQLSQQAEQLGRELAEAKSDGDREKIKGQLSEVLGKQFDQRQKRHEEEIKQLEEQIKKLKNLVDKRQENRREIIGARLSQIVKESQGLGW